MLNVQLNLMSMLQVSAVGRSMKPPFQTHFVKQSTPTSVCKS